MSPEDCWGTLCDESSKPSHQNPPLIQHTKTVMFSTDSTRLENILHKTGSNVRFLCFICTCQIRYVKYNWQRLFFFQSYFDLNTSNSHCLRNNGLFPPFNSDKEKETFWRTSSWFSIKIWMKQNKDMYLNLSLQNRNLINKRSQTLKMLHYQTYAHTVRSLH